MLLLTGRWHRIHGLFVCPILMNVISHEHPHLYSFIRVLPLICHLSDLQFHQTYFRTKPYCIHVIRVKPCAQTAKLLAVQSVKPAAQVKRLSKRYTNRLLQTLPAGEFLTLQFSWMHREKRLLWKILGSAVTVSYACVKHCLSPKSSVGNIAAAVLL